MGPFEFDTHARTSPSTLVWGFLRIEAMKAVAAQVSCESGGADTASVSIFDAGPRSASDPAMVYAKMYRLPEALAEFNGDLKAIADAAESWPFSSGRKFEESMLRPRDVPANWKHRGAQIGSAGRGIAHVWRGSRSAMLLRYAMDRGDLIDHDFFTWAAKNVSVIDGAWLLDPPEGASVAGGAEEVAEVEVIEEADEAPPIAQVYAPPPAARDRALSEPEAQQIEQSAAKMWAYLGLPSETPANELISALSTAVAQERPVFAKLTPAVQQSFCASMGAMWGILLCEEASWQWCMLSRTGVADVVAIISPDRAYAVAPIDLIVSEMTRVNGGEEELVRSLFHMIRKGALPQSRAGKYLLLN